MLKSELAQRLAVCSWSLRPNSPAELLASLAATGINRVQLALDPLRAEPAVWGSFPALAKERGVSIASGMFGTVGEDYTTLETIKRTGGVVPDETWEANWRNIQAVAEIAARLGLRLVTFHAGFLPHEESDPAFAKLLGRIEQIAALFARHGMALGFETGQETAETLAAFLRKLNRPNVGVNFDPANMILYDKGDPLQALRTLAPWLKQCHIKDARRTRVPGTWGEEVCVGTGEVPWPAFLSTIETLGYRGDLCIEREAGEQRVADIRAARLHLETLVR
ncbi:MAG: sugar phosphate isomerase/epimerase [Verrucomicrobia bacterium]|nr:sugar phosphate isomerase/epimerase [Verrucomicrobiota bacterium]